MIKKIFIAIIIFALISPLLFLAGSKCYLVFHHSKVKRQLSIENCCTITVLKNNIVWKDNGKELLINNQYFDVIEILNETNYSVTVNGVWDEMETKIEQTLQQNEKESDLSYLISLVFKWINSLVYHYNKEPYFESKAFAFSLTKMAINYCNLNMSNGFKNTLLKPPIPFI